MLSLPNLAAPVEFALVFSSDNRLARDVELAIDGVGLEDLPDFDAYKNITQAAIDIDICLENIYY